MEKSKVEFVYKNISSLNKISIVNKKYFVFCHIFVCHHLL
mgnify:CR=1 FL=1